MSDLVLSAPAGASLLTASDVTVHFGGLTALSEVSVEVAAGTITGLVGPNGAGKSTLLGVLSGLVAPSTGHVSLRGHDITNATPQARARRGLARTFQQPELFMGLTVREHLVLAHRVRVAGRRLWSDMFDPMALRRPAPEEGEHVAGVLELLDLTRIAQAPVGSLPLGLARLVEVGRALASNPTLVLLDEPLSGLDLKASEHLCHVLRRLVEQSDGERSLLIVEHDVPAVLALSTTVYVLDFGELIASGPPEEIRNDQAVQAAYLGDAEMASTSPARGGGSAGPGPDVGPLGGPGHDPTPPLLRAVDALPPGLVPASSPRRARRTR